MYTIIQKIKDHHKNITALILNNNPHTKSTTMESLTLNKTRIPRNKYFWKHWRYKEHEKHMLYQVQGTKIQRRYYNQYKRKIWGVTERNLRKQI